MKSVRCNYAQSLISHGLQSYVLIVCKNQAICKMQPVGCKCSCTKLENKYVILLIDIFNTLNAYNSDEQFYSICICICRIFSKRFMFTSWPVSRTTRPDASDHQRARPTPVFMETSLNRKIIYFFIERWETLMSPTSDDEPETVSFLV